MQGEMKRGRSQVIWRYMPFSTFRYNDDSAWCMVTDVTMDKTKELDGALADAVAAKLSYWNALGVAGFPDPRLQPQKYVVGDPYWVRYEIWPTIFICKVCKRVSWWESVNKLRSVNDRLRCRSCGNRDDVLRQLYFAYVCECGNLNTLFVPQCPKDKSHPIGLEDKRSFQDSFWFCQTCKTPISQTPRSGLGVRACQCGNAMRGTTLIDPRVYYSQTVAIVDIRPDTLAVWKQNARFSDFLLGAAMRIPSHNLIDIQNLSKYVSGEGVLSPELLAMKELLLESGMSRDQIDAMVAESARKASNDPWAKYLDELSPCRDYIAEFVASNSRQTVEYVFVREEPSVITISLDTLIEVSESTDDHDGNVQLLSDKNLCQSLGLINLAIVQDLPILLAGIGYTRYFADPTGYDGSANKSRLRAYKNDESGKIPLFAARNTTEALLYELDPWRLAAFLKLNKVVEVPEKAFSSDHVLRSWLFSISGKLQQKAESHLNLLPHERERGDTVDVPSALIFGVLHTISHALMATANQYVGIDQDALSEYLFPAHAAGLLYASSHVKFTLGGIDAVFRSNLSQWIGTMRDFSNSCSFDPVCSSAGGACLACLYTKFGCNHFNRNLSRALLFGGGVNGLEDELVGFWSHDVTVESERMRLAIAKLL